MNALPALPAQDDEMPAEIDFSGGRRGQFHKADAQLNLPVYLDQEVQATLIAEPVLLFLGLGLFNRRIGQHEAPQFVGNGESCCG